MITKFRLIKTESHVYMNEDEIKKHNEIGINYDIGIRSLHTDKSRNELGDQSTQVFEYTFSVNYMNSSMGYIRYEGTIEYQGDKKIKTVKGLNELPSKIRNEMTVAIISNLIPLALLLSKVMGLPPASPLPIPDFNQVNNEPEGMYA